MPKQIKMEQAFESEAMWLEVLEESWRGREDQVIQNII